MLFQRPLLLLLMLQAAQLTAGSDDVDDEWPDVQATYQSSSPEEGICFSNKSAYEAADDNTQVGMVSGKISKNLEGYHWFLVALSAEVHQISAVAIKNRRDLVGDKLMLNLRMNGIEIYFLPEPHSATAICGNRVLHKTFQYSNRIQCGTLNAKIVIPGQWLTAYCGQTFTTVGSIFFRKKVSESEEYSVLNIANFRLLSDKKAYKYTPKVEFEYLPQANSVGVSVWNSEATDLNVTCPSGSSQPTVNQDEMTIRCINLQPSEVHFSTGSVKTKKTQTIIQFAINITAGAEDISDQKKKRRRSRVTPSTTVSAATKLLTTNAPRATSEAETTILRTNPATKEVEKSTATMRTLLAETDAKSTTVEQTNAPEAVKSSRPSAQTIVSDRDENLTPTNGANPIGESTAETAGQTTTSAQSTFSKSNLFRNVKNAMPATPDAGKNQEKLWHSLETLTTINPDIELAKAKTKGITTAITVSVACLVLVIFAVLGIKFYMRHRPGNKANAQKTDEADGNLPKSLL